MRDVAWLTNNWGVFKLLGPYRRVNLAFGEAVSGSKTSRHVVIYSS
jgi:hypothetical protein